MGSEVEKPAAYAYVSERNSRIDAWRRKRVEKIRAWASVVHRKRLANWKAVLLARAEALLDISVAIESCPIMGAPEMLEWLEHGTSPASSDPRRSSWDKRIQRVRRWLEGELPASLHPYLKYRKKPAKPTKGKSYLMASAVHRRLSLRRKREEERRKALSARPGG